MITCSIGIMAYNEEANIGRLLGALLTQKLSTCTIKEIMVVASGCEDKTEDIVRQYTQKDSRITLIVQEQREGKASAINLFLTAATGQILVLVSGDTIPEKNAIQKLLLPFDNDEIGMTGGHPVPVNSQDTLIGYAVHLQWRLHHRIALISPKLGELIAFRNIVKEIPHDTAVDEASIEAIVTAAGFKLQYAGDAIVYNKGPENIKDFLRQRRRIAAGHLYVKNFQKYAVSTTSIKNILPPLIKETPWSIRGLVWTSVTVFLEMIGRGLGYYDLYIRKQNPFIWDIASSTKKLGRNPS